MVLAPDSDAGRGPVGRQPLVLILAVASLMFAVSKAVPLLIIQRTPSSQPLNALLTHKKGFFNLAAVVAILARAAGLLV